MAGIAYHTHIPYDIIYDAASGSSNQLSITPWVKIIDLYLQVKPDITAVLVDKLLELKSKSSANLLSLLSTA